MIQYNENELIKKFKSIKDDNSVDYEEIMDFINSPEASQLIDEEQFDDLYHSYNIRLDKAAWPLTIALLISGINFLDKLKTLPRTIFYTMPITHIDISPSWDRLATQCLCRTELKEIIVPEGIHIINIKAFAFNDNLQTVVLPKSLKYIGSSIFAGCPSTLSSIKYMGTKEEWNEFGKSDDWDFGSSITTIQCSDGVIDLTDIYD